MPSPGLSDAYERVAIANRERIASRSDSGRRTMKNKCHFVEKGGVGFGETFLRLHAATARASSVVNKAPAVRAIARPKAPAPATKAPSAGGKPREE
jgi:hypothetical protein